MQPTVPELGAGGWVTDPLKTLDLVISHAFETDYSQSSIYPGNVTSIAYILSQYQNSPSRMVEEIQKALIRLLNRYFEAVDVLGSYTEYMDDNRYELKLDVTAKRNGRSYNLTQVYNISNGRFNRVLEEINR